MIFRAAATAPSFPHSYPFTFILVVVGLFFQKLIMISGNHGSNGDGSLGSTSSRSYFDPRFKRLLWYLIGSTKGGYNRARILEYINSNPANANQIASELKLDYKTITHHLDVLSKNGLVVTDNKESYGATYFLTPLLEKNYESFKDILAKIGKR